MKLHIYFLLAFLSVSCAAKKTTLGPEVKPGAPASAKSESTAKVNIVAKEATQKKPSQPVIIKEETISTQEVMEVVPFAASDSDFKKR